ncbi:PadR family transcriptional regulator [Haloechinothrix halophila]|uniref:PadR family transcriptional regulator n=1 Tax=Haloechinothrix halophila TaxID=1069073 RepID=UPI0004275C37|nr:PadR family transcriptional regulator [Haloechinothrix halophila]
MSVKHGLLALLQDGSKYGYQLRAEFESATGATWPLNIGQVYSTLARLDRDGLVEAVGATGDEDDDTRSRYRITDAGRAELHGWFDTPVARRDRPRDELAIKLALAVAVPGIDVRAIIQRQRTTTMRSLQELTTLKRNAAADDVSWLLVVESMIFAAEAEIRWLDHCEAMLVRVARKPAGGSTGTSDPAGLAGPDAIGAPR